MRCCIAAGAGPPCSSSDAACLRYLPSPIAPAGICGHGGAQISNCSGGTQAGVRQASARAGGSAQLNAHDARARSNADGHVTTLLALSPDALELVVACSGFAGAAAAAAACSGLRAAAGTVLGAPYARPPRPRLLARCLAADAATAAAAGGGQVTAAALAESYIRAFARSPLGLDDACASATLHELRALGVDWTASARGVLAAAALSGHDSTARLALQAAQLPVGQLPLGCDVLDASLEHAVEHGQAATARALLRLGATSSASLLRKAAAAGHNGVIRELLDVGEVADRQCLRAVARAGRGDTVYMLLHEAHVMPNLNSLHAVPPPTHPHPRRSMVCPCCSQTKPHTQKDADGMYNNLVPCCATCNKAKGGAHGLTGAEWIALARAVAAHLSNRRFIEREAA